MLIDSDCLERLYKSRAATLCRHDGRGSITALIQGSALHETSSHVIDIFMLRPDFDALARRS